VDPNFGFAVNIATYQLDRESLAGRKNPWAGSTGSIGVVGAFQVLSI